LLAAGNPAAEFFGDNQRAARLIGGEREFRLLVLGTIKDVKSNLVL
jgi:hypothetical protein